MEAFSQSTDFAFSVPEIMKYEQSMLKILNWAIDYPTLAFWLNLFTYQWDEFVSKFRNNYDHDLISKNVVLIKFRNSKLEQCQAFCYAGQIIDIMVLDIEYLQYPDRLLVISVMYLVLGLNMECFTLNDVILKFSTATGSHSQYYDLNIIFNRFISSVVGFELDNIRECVQYASSFFILPYDNSLYDRIRQNFTVKHLVLKLDILQ